MWHSAGAAMTSIHRMGLALATSLCTAGVAVGFSATAAADITPHHDSMITTNACEDILLHWSDGQIIDNLAQRYAVSSQVALQVVTEMRIPGNCVYDADF